MKSTITIMTPKSVANNNKSIQSSASTPYEELTGYEKNKSLFWCFATMCLCIAIVTVVGNVMVIVASKRKQNFTRLRYFDGIVKSLAVTDFLFGLIGVPLMVINYYLVGDKKILVNTFEEELLKLVPNILTACNCIHIVYLVYLRSMAIETAMKCKKMEQERHLKSIIVMWIGPILANLVPLVCTRVQKKEILFYLVYRHALLYGFHTIPIILIIIFHMKMIRKVNENNKTKMKRMSQSSDASKLSDKVQKTSTKMIKRVAITLIVCYLPYLSWWQYSMIVFRADGGRRGCDTNAAELVFAALSRILMLINSSLNPFIYASTIPAFKQIVKRYFICKFDDANIEESKLKRTFSSASRTVFSIKSNTSN